MKNEIILNLRQFPGLAHDHRTGTEEAIVVTVTKHQLQAATIVGQSSKELIERLCDRQGYHFCLQGLFGLHPHRRAGKAAGRAGKAGGGDEEVNDYMKRVERAKAALVGRQPSKVTLVYDVLAQDDTARSLLLAMLGPWDFSDLEKLAGQ